MTSHTNVRIVARPVPESPDLPAEIHPLLQRVYAARGVSSAAELERSLAGLPAPELMLGMAEAVAIVGAAIAQHQSILIVGDFDADGATSSALAVLALRAMGAHCVDYLVPNRFEYGYGLTPEIVELAAERKPDLIITVDNGIASVEGVARAHQHNIAVVVTDHHLPGEQLPAAAAIVNPNQYGCNFPHKNLAGVGVIFYLMLGLRSALRESGWFDAQRIREPNLADLLDIVALGTVADVVPLDELNRKLVWQGVQRIRAGRCRPGINALMKVAGRDCARAVASDMGFTVGPRLNAAGRLDDMSLGIECLLADDPNYAENCARQLDELNRDRRAIEQQMQQEALAQVASLKLDEADMPWGLTLFQAEWHQGIVGLLASRIREKYHRPVFAFAPGEDGQLKGSGRSITGLHLRDVLVLMDARYPHLIGRFGGHAMAAGLTLAAPNLELFRARFDATVRELLSADELDAVLHTDGELTADDFELATAHLLREAGPWGQHFPEPQFEGEFELLEQRIVGSNHLKLRLKSAAGQAIDAIHFNCDLAIWPDATITRARAVYKLDVNEWRGVERLQLLVDYLEPICHGG